MGQVPLPVRCCHRCLESYNHAEWQALELAAVLELPGGRMVERRACGRCGVTLELCPQDLERLVLSMPAEQYQRLFPESHRPALADAGAREFSERSCSWAQSSGLWTLLAVAAFAGALAGLVLGYYGGR